MSILTVTTDLGLGVPSVRVVYHDANGGKHGIPLSPSEADALAAELTKAAVDARANERRCGTCGHRADAGMCSWRVDGLLPPWASIARPVVSDNAYPNRCPAWTKRDGGQ